jgi:hypothetical protein
MILSLVIGVFTVLVLLLVRDVQDELGKIRRAIEDQDSK